MAELTAVLVSAFKIAWLDYYGRPESNLSVSKEVARPALAKFLVDKSREGMTDEAILAAAGLNFLIALETPDKPIDRAPTEPASWHLSGTGTARFIPQGRIRLRTK